jgi:hypothetical protein
MPVNEEALNSWMYVCTHCYSSFTNGLHVRDLVLTLVSDVKHLKGGIAGVLLGE